jgi:hypothetical protein
MNGDTLWSMTPERMLREIFGETDLEEPPPRTPPNTTPLFRLAAIMPEFADELSRLLIEQRRNLSCRQRDRSLGFRQMSLRSRPLRHNLYAA